MDKRAFMASIYCSFWATLSVNGLFSPNANIWNATESEQFRVQGDIFLIQTIWILVRLRFSCHPSEIQEEPLCRAALGLAHLWPLGESQVWSHFFLKPHVCDKSDQVVSFCLKYWQKGIRLSQKEPPIEASDSKVVFCIKTSILTTPSSWGLPRSWFRP